MKTAQRPMGEQVGALTPPRVMKDRPFISYHKPRKVWKGRVWRLLKPYQRLQIITNMARRGGGRG